ncbi:MAG: glycoside hydrolase family 3 N-terminal domain-containing protein [Fermentimonas sp.]|nr:glycoside hydrolase family 3 N-terminal domain-containing protein [Fermentimonas sp.]
MKRTLLLFIISFCALITSAQVTTNLYKQSDRQAMDRWVDSVYSTLSLDEKVGQLFMPIVESQNDWKPRIAGYIRNQKVGGLLFSKGTLSQQANITNYAQELSEVPLFISLDGEWGLSMRIQDAPQFPRNMIIGAIHDEEIVELYGAEVARQCKEMGIHINFAPVIDVNSNTGNPVIGNRSFGENPENVAKKGIAYAKGLEGNGVMAVAKHFPGHGDTSEDSHKTLPTIAHSKDRIELVELYPFRQYINAGLSGMMTGHLNVPALETKGLPSTLSPEVGIKLLKEEMGFTGLAFTDAMAMKGVSGQEDASVRALLAGNDIILGVINQKKEFESVKKAVEEGRITASMLEEKVRKILSYKYILGADKFTPINTSNVHNAVNSPAAEWTQRKIYDGAVTLVKNNNNLVPLKELDKKNIASIAIGATTSNTFQKYLKKYGDVTTYQAQTTLAATQISDLNKHDLVIVSIHSDKLSDLASLQKLADDKPLIFVLFASPYTLGKFNLTTANAMSVVVAYDNSEFAQMSAAQGIFGGIAMSGKLPLSAGTFKEGTGIDTEKTRLSYSMPEEVGLQSIQFDNIEHIALEGIRQRAYPGCQILVAKDGVIIYQREFGNMNYGDSPDVTSETVYDLASVTKASATLPAVMKLYDEKKLALQDNLGKFVKETKGSNKENIRIRSLLLHESGIVSFIPYYVTAIDKESYSGALFGSRSHIFHARYAGAWGRTDYKFHPDMISSKASEEFYMPVAKNMYASDKMHSALLKDVIDTPLQRVGQYRYSCLNFMMLKETVENISGVDLDNFVQSNFFNRLGSTTTTFLPLRYIDADRIAPTENDPFFRKQHLRGYVHDEGAALFGGISGNAGLFSNANDLAKLYQMWLNEGEYGGERYLSKETVELFTTAKSSISRRGMGFDKPDPRNTRANPTSPGTPLEVYGHTGFTGTSFWVDPTNDMIYIFLSNRVNPARSPDRLSSLEIRERIQEELYKALGNNKTPGNNKN